MFLSRNATLTSDPTRSFEMILFGFLHMKAFAFGPYVVTSDKTGQTQKTPFWPSLMHAFNFRDWARETKDSTLHLALTVRGQHRPIEVERRTDLFAALGTSRPRCEAAEVHDVLDLDAACGAEKKHQPMMTIGTNEEEASALLALEDAEKTAQEDFRGFRGGRQSEPQDVCQGPARPSAHSFHRETHRRVEPPCAPEQHWPQPEAAAPDWTPRAASPMSIAELSQRGPRHPDLSTTFVGRPHQRQDLTGGHAHRRESETGELRRGNTATFMFEEV